jgi:hypothetical protein
VNKLPYTFNQISQAMRLILAPGHLALQLPENGAIVTDIAIAGIEYKVGGAAQLLTPTVQDFAYAAGPDHFYYDKVGVVDAPFNITITQSFSQTIGQPNAELILRLRKNGTPIPGIFTRRTIRTSDTVGVISLEGHLTLSTNDYLELTVESDKVGNFNAWAFAASLLEENT